MSRRSGGDLGYSFLTLVELNFELWTNERRGRKQAERESSLSTESGNMPKEQASKQASTLVVP
jgi:hypothetical protein